MEAEKPLADRVDDLEIALLGRVNLGAPGLLNRVHNLEEIIRRWQRMEWMLAGALALMSVTSIANILAVAKTFGLLP
jgi:hypothetical protein